MTNCSRRPIASTALGCPVLSPVSRPPRSSHLRFLCKSIRPCRIRRLLFRRGHSGRGFRFPGLGPQGECILTKKLYVGNLPYDATADELREAFSAYGRVLSATIACDRETGQSRGFGFVELFEGAEEAIQALNQARLGNRSLIVNEAKPRER
jgi:hypothetical protein